MRKRCVYNHGDSYLFRFTYTYANYPSSGGFRRRQKCRPSLPRCLPFWVPFLFWLSRFYKLSFRLHFNVSECGKVMRNAVTWSFWYLLFFYCLQNNKDVLPISTYNIIGDIWRTEKFAFTNDTFLHARFRNVYPLLGSLFLFHISRFVNWPVPLSNRIFLRFPMYTSSKVLIFLPH